MYYLDVLAVNGDGEVEITRLQFNTLKELNQVIHYLNVTRGIHYNLEDKPVQTTSGVTIFLEDVLHIVSA